MASIPVLEEVQRLLKPFEGAIIDFYLNAWTALKAMQGAPNPMYRRVRAGILHNFVMNEAVPALATMGVHPIEKHETAFFVVDGRLLFRLKKADEQGMTSNAESQASLAFVDPEQPISLFTDLPDVWRVDVSYILNKLDTLIEQIVVVCRDIDRVVWRYSFYPAASDGLQPIPFPSSPRQPPSPDSVLRVPGADRDEKKKEGE